MSPPTPPLMDHECIVILPAVAGLLLAMVLSITRPSRLNQWKSALSMTLDWPTGWRAGLPKVPTGETAFIPAKFAESSACRMVVVSNHSSHSRTLKFATSEEEFSTGIHAPFGLWTRPSAVFSTKLNEHLEPGAVCFESVEFWPTTGEVHRATIEVTVEGGNRSEQRFSELREPRTTRRNYR
jgi:hypothetical protein